jgi:hypothetical protein
VRPFIRFPRGLALAAAGLLAALLWTHPAFAQESGKDKDTEKGKKETAPASASAPSASASPLARYVQRDDVVFYVEFDGLAAHDEVWAASAADKILNQTSTGAMLEDLVAQLAEKTPLAGAGKALTGIEAVAILKHIAQNGLVLAANAKTTSPGGAADPSAALMTCVFRGAGRKEARPLFGKLLGSLMGNNTTRTPEAKPNKRRVIVVKSAAPNVAPWTWWVEKDEDLVLCGGSPDHADRVINVIDKKTPNAIDQPLRSELAKPDGPFQPVLWSFVDIENFPPIVTPPNAPKPPKLADLGLEGLKRIDCRWGFEGAAMMSVVRLAAPSPRMHALALADNQPAFDLKSLPPLPSSLEGFTTFSLELNGWLKQVWDPILAKVPAGQRVAAEEFLKKFKDTTKRDLRQDVLGQLGPRFAYFTMPSKKAAASVANPLAGVMSGGVGLQFPKTVIIAEVKDPKAFTKTLDDLILFANKGFKNASAGAAGDQAAAGKSNRSGSSAAVPRFSKSAGKTPTYILTLPAAQAALTNLNLTIALGKKYLVIATASDAAKQVAALEGAKDEDRWKPSGDLAGTVSRLPKKFAYFQLEDLSKSLPVALASLPATLKAMGAQLAAAAAGPNGAMAMATAPPAGTPGGALAAGGEEGGGRRRGAGGGGFRPRGASLEGGGGRQPAEGAPPGGAAPPPGAGGAPGAQGTTAATAGATASFEINLDASKAPSASDIKPLLFPSTLVMTTDAEGIRIITRQAFPDVAGLALAVPSFQIGRNVAQAQLEGKPIGLSTLGLPSFGPQPGAGMPGAPGGPPAAAGTGGGGARSSSAD